MRNHPFFVRRRGFTLVEFMVTIAVLSIVLAVAVPSMSSLAANNQVASVKSAFSASVALARTEAAKRGKSVIIKAASGGIGGNEYAGGWELYVDENADSAVGSGDTLVRRYEVLPDKVKLSGASTFAFQSTGALSTTATQTFTVCRIAGSNAGYQILVTPSGIVDVSAITSCS
ncbi:MAG: GspH/FimT family pseudopilin [Burkholderiales bacterium]|nr:GspH/FimT family pseudopilin [Burkholderiales bacterium]